MNASASFWNVIRLSNELCWSGWDYVKYGYGLGTDSATSLSNGPDYKGRAKIKLIWPDPTPQIANLCVYLFAALLWALDQITWRVRGGNMYTESFPNQ